MLKLNFTTLTPLHISNGEQLGYGLDYIQKGDSIYKLNPQSVAQVFASKKLIDFSDTYTLNKLIKLVEDNSDELGLEQAFYRVTCTREFIDYLNSETRRGQKFIREFINVNGNFYIPASSVKGALLTIFNKTLLEFSKVIDGEEKQIIIKQDFLGIKEVKAEGKVIVESNIKDKFVLSDSQFLASTDFSVYILDRPPSQNLICLNPNVNFNLSIKKIGNLDTELLKKNLNVYSKEQIEKAKKFIHIFERNKGKQTKGSRFFTEALNNLTSELRKIKSSEYLVNIGFGGGTYFKIYSDIEKMPKNRKNEFVHTSYTNISEDMRNHIGWCKLKIEEE